MEQIETNDPKNLLLRKSAQQKQELQDEVKLLSEKTEKIVTNALIIGGTLAVTYFLVRRFSKSKSKGKSKAKKIKVVHERDDRTQTVSAEDTSGPGVMSQIGSALAAQATVFLLDLAKDKLSGFLTTHFDKKAENINERS